MKYSVKPNLILAGMIVIMGTAWSGAREQYTVIGYHAWWMGNSLTESDLEAYDDVIFFGLDVEQDGSFATTNGWPSEWTELIHSSHRQNVGILPCITLLDARKFTILFSNGAYQTQLLNNIMEAVRSSNADGVHLDFEVFDPVSEKVRDNFTRFVGRVRQALNDYHPGTRLYVFTLALDPGEVYDEVSLAQIADFLVVQAYDLHWKDGAEAGPVSPLTGWGKRNWKTILATYDAKSVPRRKILFSVPYFGYEWPTISEEIGSATRGEGRTLTYSPVEHGRISHLQKSAREQVLEYGFERDSESGSPFYRYKGNDGWYQGWYEDEQSLALKYAFVRANKLGGIAIFAHGYDNGELRNVVKRNLPR